MLDIFAWAEENACSDLINLTQQYSIDIKLRMINISFYMDSLNLWYQFLYKKITKNWKYSDKK